MDFLLGASRQLSSINIKKYLRYISKVSFCCDFEVCGLVFKDKLKFLKNLSAEKQHSFFIDPKEYAFCYSEIIFSFHSHPQGSDSFSEEDLISAEESMIPQLVFNTKTHNFIFYDPQLEKQFIFALKSV